VIAGQSGSFGGDKRKGGNNFYHRGLKVYMGNRVSNGVYLPGFLALLTSTTKRLDAKTDLDEELLIIHCAVAMR